jgi:hypothetical protein
MDYLNGDQLSLIAETEDYAPSGDWHYDTPVQARSIDEHRQIWIQRARDGGQNKNLSLPVALHRGGQAQTRITPMEGNGGQNKNSGIPPSCPPSLFTKSEGDDGTWIEIQRRAGGEYRYLRWREVSGKKRSKYLGKV